MQNNLLSADSINSAVRKAAFQHPLLLYPAVLAIISLTAYFLDLFEYGHFSALVFTVIAGVAAGLQLSVQRDRHASRYIDGVRSKLASDRNAALVRLKKSLAELDQEEATNQLKLLGNKYQNFVTILNTKLNRSEFTYIRYLTICEQVYLGALDNLEDICNTLRSISAIDINMLTKQLSDGDPAHQEQLQIRRNLYHQQMQKVSRLLSTNQIAMTKLDTVTVRLADLKTKQGRASMQIDESLTELQDLILSTHKYST